MVLDAGQVSWFHEDAAEAAKTLLSHLLRRKCVEHDQELKVGENTASGYVLREITETENQLASAT